MPAGDAKMFDQWKEANLREGRSKVGEQHRRKRQSDRDKLRAEIERLQRERDAIELELCQMAEENERLQAALRVGQDTVLKLQNEVQRHYVVERKDMAEIERLQAALGLAADYIKDLDGGDQSSETGWKSDELLDMWLKIKAALGKEE